MIGEGERWGSGALFPSPGNVLSQRSPGGRRPFVKRLVTSTASTGDPAGSLCIDLTGSLSPFFNINDGSLGSVRTGRL